MLDKLGPQSAGVTVSGADLQLKLTDKSSLATATGMGMENGAGKKLMEITGPALSKRKLLVGLDLLCLFLASIPFFACELKAVSPYRRGFMCGDPSITYPYLHQEAIPDELLIAGGIIITGLTIALGECYRVRFRGVSSKAFVRNLYVSCLYKELGCLLHCCCHNRWTNMAVKVDGRDRTSCLCVRSPMRYQLHTRKLLQQPSTSHPCLKVPDQISPTETLDTPCHLTTPSAKPHPLYQPLPVVWFDRQ
ncbi:phospholipid phosphatase 3-like protein [Lates japonicus]|uniref:Phospholipid phosphatase 3-like protein n=1 Tax=Lates japonicus TaxID=270547 RepID=A0AAD3R8A1_LATJO|nr:phospholipid phosphatase 3-like protein [Lates japonicus]